jgi:hypothetical protein
MEEASRLLRFSVIADKSQYSVVFDIIHGNTLSLPKNTTIGYTTETTVIPPPLSQVAKVSLLLHFPIQ